MSLKAYQQKRRFDHSNEPKGRVRAQDKSFIYCIQKHAASHLHYDFRLALNGVLKSWAIPKGPSFDPANKHLAIAVEDHPLEYAEFEGTIPEQEYGAGTVMLWDRGTWEPIGDPKTSLQKGKLVFNLHGEKLTGRWTLLRLRNADKKQNWLLIKNKDEYAHLIAEQKLLASNSVKTGRSLAEIGKAAKKVSPAQLDLKKLSGAKSSPMPKKFALELATLVKSVPGTGEWLYEIKFDGIRILGIIEHGKVQLVTRNGHDWTAKFPAIAEALALLPVQSAVVDGEVVALDKHGVSRFQLLQNAIKAGTSPLHYHLFDLMYCNGFDLTQVALQHRKACLQQLFAKMPETVLHYSAHLPGAAKDIFAFACRANLEGIIAKRIDSHYLAKRTMDWLKIKCVQRQEFVIIGFTDPGGARPCFGALLIGYYDKSKHLIYSGRVGTGFNQSSLREIYQIMKPYQQNQTPVYQLPNIPEVKNVHWLKPELVCEIEFTEWTHDGRIRHPSFKGLREDKPAIEIYAELPVAANSDNEVDALNITHPERLYYPKANISKGDLAHYYQRYWQWLGPELINRPLAILRCPAGLAGDCFYQKHVETLPDSIGRVLVNEKHDQRMHIVIRSLSDVLTLVQYGALELHTWGCHADDIEMPDRMIFDLDPGLNVTFPAMIAAAKALRKCLESLGLSCFVKTSGKKGLHVVVPLQRQHTWTEVKAFSKAMADHMVTLAPECYTATITKAKRSGKVFIDYLRNQRGATCIAAYSTRATDLATISTPLHWRELSKLKSAGDFSLANIGNRLSRLKHNPWQDYQAAAGILTKQMWQKMNNDE